LPDSLRAETIRLVVSGKRISIHTEASMKATLSLGLAAMIVISALATFTHARPDDAKSVTGVLIDQACAAKMMSKDDPQAAATKHPKACCMKDACASSGFAVISGKHLYKLDADGSKMAKEYLAKDDSTTMVTVTGDVESDKIDEVKSIAPAEKH